MIRNDAGDENETSRVHTHTVTITLTTALDPVTVIPGGGGYERIAPSPHRP